MSVLDFVFPKRCVGCGSVGKYICVPCRSAIRYIAFNEPICPVCGRPALDGATHPGCRSRYGLDGLTSFFHYHGVVRKAVKAIKYRFVSDSVREFVDLAPDSILKELRLKYRDSVLVPIPLHRTRLQERGFNQADVLGRELSLRLGIPFSSSIIVRTRQTVPQVVMKDRSERLRNMQGVFAVRAGATAPQQILLFDDVFTTGATMRSAANVLKRKGAKFVWAVTMAR